MTKEKTLKQQILGILSLGAASSVVLIYGAYGAGVAASASADQWPEYATSFKEISSQAQTLSVSEDVEMPKIERSSYLATTAAELQTIRREQAQLAAAGYSVYYTPADVRAGNPKIVGDFAVPLVSYHFTYANNGFRTSDRPTHNGFDMLTSALDPIFAAHSGTVVTSTDFGGGYGAYVQVAGTDNGKQIVTTYAHMTYGTRKVAVGEQVTVGQILGGVGTTGRSSANHLHFEVQLNGAFVNPQTWLKNKFG